MGDLVKSAIRTLVPVVVGLILATLAKAGIDLDPETAGALAHVIDAVVVGAYYVAVRFLERRFPAAGWLLGLPAPPTYTGTTRAPR